MKQSMWFVSEEKVWESSHNLHTGSKCSPKTHPSSSGSDYSSPIPPSGLGLTLRKSSKVQAIIMTPQGAPDIPVSQHVGKPRAMNEATFGPRASLLPGSEAHGSGRSERNGSSGSSVRPELPCPSALYRFLGMTENRALPGSPS